MTDQNTPTPPPAPLVTAATAFIRLGVPTAGYACWVCGERLPAHVSDCEWAALAAAVRDGSA